MSPRDVEEDMAIKPSPSKADPNGVTAHGSSDDDSSEELERTKLPNDNDEEPPLFQFLTGMKEDLAARLPLYLDDWGRPRSFFTVLNATLFAFVIQLIPALIFAELMDRETRGHIATAETLLSSAIIGIIYALFSGQPLVIMGITGPVALLLGTSYGLTAKFDAEYFPFFFWTCLWAGLMHCLSAMVGLVSLVWKVTPFTCQIFELFIAVTFIYTSVRDLVQPLYLGQGEYREDRSTQYATLMLGLLTCSIAWTLHFAETWIYSTRQVRIFLSSYNTMIACVVVTALSFLPGVDQPNNPGGSASSLERVNIRFAPWDWQPTYDRAWLVNPLDGIDAKGIFGAIIPGFMFFLLFIIDHNVSSILTQSPKFNLKKPPAYNWDFFVLGLTFLPCAIMGLPPGNGLIPQAPLHCRALCTRAYVTDPANPNGPKKEVVTHCEEQRWSGLGQSLLMFVALACFTVLSWIPRGVLFGLFLYLGMGALHGNEIWERTLLCLILPKKRPNIPVVTQVSSWRTVQYWTLIQLACAFLIFAIGQFTDFGYIYPALLTALVPIRSYILARWFDEEDLKHLDPVGESEDDYHEEQKAIREAERRGSYDEDEVMDFPNRAMFRNGPDQQEHPGLVRRHTIAKTEDIPGGSQLMATYDNSAGDLVGIASAANVEVATSSSTKNNATHEHEK